MSETKEKVNPTITAQGKTETPVAAEPTPVYKKLPLTDKGMLLEKAPLLQGPRSLVIISFPKSGKTDNMCGVPNFLIGDCEDGAAYFEGSNDVDLKKFNGPHAHYKTKSGAFIPAGLYETCQELYRANNMKLFNTLVDELKLTRSKAVHTKLVKVLQDMPFPIFVVDTLTHFIKLVYEAALAEYNEALDPSKHKGDIKRADNYGGVQYIRRAVEDIKSFIEKNAAPFIVYNGHIKMKKSVLNKSDEEISTVDLALEGTLPTIFTSHASAVCTLYRDDTGVHLDFQKKGEDDTDARPRHLGGNIIKIADLHEFQTIDDVRSIKTKGKTYWDRIYPELKF